MGYYSNVKIMCEEKAFEKLKEIFLDETKCIMPDRVYRLPELDNAYSMEWNDLKWYDDPKYFPGVYEIMRSLDNFERLDIEEDGWGFNFTRIGEEFGDVEIIETTNDFYFDVITEIRNSFKTEDISLEIMKEK